MKNEEIRNAFDSVTPDVADVNRMRNRLLDALPPEDGSRKVRVSSPEKSNWWSVVPAAAACAAVLLLCGFVVSKLQLPDQNHELQTSPTETLYTQPDDTQEETKEPPTEPVVVNIPDQTIPDSPEALLGPGTYLDYVSRVRQRNKAEGRSSQYYAYYDLNGDGVQDLLIGSDQDHVKEAITCIDGELSILFSIGCDFTICTDGSIYTGQEGDTHFVWYRLSGHEQYVTMTVWYDEQMGRWYQYTSAIDKKTTITRSDVEKLLASYEPVDLDIKNLNRFTME